MLSRLREIALDESSPLPVYYQVYEGLRGMLESAGDPAIAPGTKLPTERAMAAELGIARATLRQALTRLENDGLVTRRQGDGTYVAEALIRHDINRLQGFTRELTARGKRVRSRLLSFKTTAAPAKLRDTLGVGAGPDEAIELRRVRLLDDEPVTLETVWLPRHRAARLVEFDLNHHSLYDALHAIGVVPVRGREELTATTLDEFEASHLDQRSGAPALHISRVTFDDAGQCVECVKTIIRADRFMIQTSLDLEQA